MAKRKPTKKFRTTKETSPVLPPGPIAAGSPADHPAFWDIMETYAEECRAIIADDISKLPAAKKKGGVIHYEPWYDTAEVVLAERILELIDAVHVELRNRRTAKAFHLAYLLGVATADFWAAPDEEIKDMGRAAQERYRRSTATARQSKAAKVMTRHEQINAEVTDIQRGANFSKTAAIEKAAERLSVSPSTVKRAQKKLSK